MRRSSTAAIIASVVVATAVSGVVLWSAQARGRGNPPPGTAQNPPAPSRAFPNEQAWLVSEVANAIVQMAQSQAPRTGELPTFKVDIQDHIWSPATYAPMAAALFAGGGESAPDTDINARTPLTMLTVDVLLEQNERLSAMLGRDMRSAAAHESAALLVAAHALREAPSMFADVRSALSRIAAHLAVADALRRQPVRSLDGALAHVVLTTLVGRQGGAMTQLEAIERRASTDIDRAWVRALRLRITGDWRAPLAAGSTMLERLEYARALRTRAGSDRLLEFLDGLEIDEAQTDWHRIALTEGFNIEAGGRFTEDIAERELAEAEHVWASLHGRRPASAELMTALNDRPESGPVVRASGAGQVRIVGWEAWAAFEQRQLSHALTAQSRHLYNLSSRSEQTALVNEVRTTFSGLSLYPIVLRWLSLTPADYEDSMTRARRLASTTPQLITVASWNLLAEKPPFVRQTSPFPFVQSWFEPAVPQGTGFDLYARALLPGCPRPPSAQQARQWADYAPYDHWVRWSADWLAVTGKPRLANIRLSFGQLLEYDYGASMKLIDYMDMSSTERIEVARQLCTIATGRCDVLAELLVRDGRDAEAVTEYERWIANSRDSVKVSNHLTWLVRYYQRSGRIARAEEVAQIAASAGSYTGLETYAHLLDVQGRYDEAELVYQKIADRYDNTTPLGSFMIRQALRRKDRALELRGWDLLRTEFPGGLQRVELHALDVPPRDGMVFNTFGRRAASAGLRDSDIVVGVDEWRVRNHRQYSVISRLRHDEAMTFVVWRGGQYQQIRARVPERWLGLRLADYLGARTGH